MANSKINENEDILIKVDQNNLIYVDPNSVVVDGQIESRGIKQENLVTYVNLEADLVPRTTLISENQKSTMVSIAEGTLNFMKKNGGGDYDSTWTDSFNYQQPGNDNLSQTLVNLFGSKKHNDDTAQTFGIDSININIKGGGLFHKLPLTLLM